MSDSVSNIGARSLISLDRDLEPDISQIRASGRSLKTQPRPMPPTPDWQITDTLELSDQSAPVKPLILNFNRL